MLRQPDDDHQYSDKNQHDKSQSLTMLKFNKQNVFLATFKRYLRSEQEDNRKCQECQQSKDEVR